jgi:hypothetical protein
MQDVLIPLMFAIAVMALATFFGVRGYRKQRAALQGKAARQAASRPEQPRTAPGATADVGPLVWTYTSDDARRGRGALGAVCLGVVGLIGCGGLIVVTEIASARTPGSTDTPFLPFSLGAGLSLGLLGSGIFLGVRYFTGRGETFAVHEGGLVHTRAGVATALAWGDVDTVDNHAQTSWLASVMGTDVACTVRYGGDARFLITGHVHHARHLAHTVEQAVFHGTAPRRPHAAGPGPGNGGEESRPHPALAPEE